MINLKERTKMFAYWTIKMVSFLKTKNTLSEIVRRQLLKAATSVAVNYRAAYIAPTRKSFGSKLSICAEEADESAFWIELIYDHELIDANRSDHILQHTPKFLLNEAIELKKIFIASRKTVAEGQLKRKKVRKQDYEPGEASGCTS